MTMQGFRMVYATLVALVIAIGMAPTGADAVQATDFANSDDSAICNQQPALPRCDKTGRRAMLIEAIRSGSTQRALAVLRELADVNFVTYDGTDSPLSLAVTAGRKEITAQLLQRGADPIAVDRSGNLRLHSAIRDAWKPTRSLGPEVIDCVRIVLEQAARQRRLPSKPLLDARVAFDEPYRVSAELLKVLLEYGADPNVKDAKGEYLFDRAVREKNADVVQILAGAKTDLSQAGLDAKAYDALASGNTALLEALKTASADPARYARTNPEAIFDAVRAERSTDVLEFVLKSGANPNAVRHEKIKTTPIFAAGFDGEKMKLLLQYGADANARDGYTILATLLFYHGSQISVPARKSAQAPRLYDKSSLVSLLLDHGAELNVDHGGWGRWGALGLTRREDKDVIELLIKRGATLRHDVSRSVGFPLRKEKQDGSAEDGATGPIVIAVHMLEREDLALALLARDKKITASDRLALLHAARRGWRGVVEALLQAGADPNAADRHGLVPLAIAERRRDKNIVEALVKAGARRPAKVAPLFDIQIGGEFETAVAKEMDDVVFLDPPRFYLDHFEETPFVLYGEDTNKYSEVKCERSVKFAIVANRGVAGSIGAGVCEKEAERIDKLAARAQRRIDELLHRLDKGGAKVDRAKAIDLGWIYENRAYQDSARVHYFPVIAIGHGILSFPTIVFIPATKNQAVVVQADLATLCGEGSSMQSQTPLCNDTTNALIDIAQRIYKKLNSPKTKETTSESNGASIADSEAIPLRPENKRLSPHYRFDLDRTRHLSSAVAAFRPVCFAGERLETEDVEITATTQLRLRNAFPRSCA